MTLAEILREHWPSYVKAAGGPAAVPAHHWRAVEAVLSCRTARRGGHRHRCARCRKDYFLYHSCNHRSCPQCGGRSQQEWTARQEARLLPVPYYLVTFTVPDQLRALFLRHPQETYNLLFSEGGGALSDLCADPKYAGGKAGFIAVLHTWTRQMLFHPHLHVLIPAVTLAENGCELIHPRNEEFLVHVKALAARFRNRFCRALGAKHPTLKAIVEPDVWKKEWVVHCQHVGRGRTALRYLAAYVCKSALSQKRLLGRDRQGRILLRWKESESGQWKIAALEPHEFIRRWLLHVLPRGFVRVRHLGWLSPAAGRSFRIIRFLLKLGTVRVTPLPRIAPRCPCCQSTLERVGTVAQVRGPPLSHDLLRAA